MLADLPGQRPAIGLGHPVLGLDEVVGSNARLERLEELGVLEILDLRRLLKLGRVHGLRCSPDSLNVQISKVATPLRPSIVWTKFVQCCSWFLLKPPRWLTIH